MSRQEILRRINAKVGYIVREDQLSPATRQAITSLAIVQRHLQAVTELLRGEQSRIDRSLILRTASKLGKDPEKTERQELAEEMSKLQSDVDVKVEELSNHILAEERARHEDQPPPERDSGTFEVAKLKCPTCNASLPLPTGRFVKCQYCGTTMSIQEVTSQISSIIQKI